MQKKTKESPKQQDGLSLKNKQFIRNYTARELALMPVFFYIFAEYLRERLLL